MKCEGGGGGWKLTWRRRGVTMEERAEMEDKCLTWEKEGLTWSGGVDDREEGFDMEERTDMEGRGTGGRGVT